MQAASRRTGSGFAPHTTLAAIASLLWASAAVAQVRPVQPVSPFLTVGFIQDATLGGTDTLAGGTVTVNNQVITVPSNTIVLMPATALTWKEVFDLAPEPYKTLQKSGLALRDVPTPIGAYEVTIQGNRVGDEYIAGLVSLSQLSLFSSQGFINHIDYGTGEVRVGGVMGSNSTGQRVLINDPIGKFGRAFSPDVRFTIDEDNPTIRTETAYPMCVPRVDPAGGVPDDLCPQSNRPIDGATGFYATIFTMNAGETPSVERDPHKQMPFELGDYVTYAGILVKDGNEPTVGPLPDASSTYVAAYSMVANLGVFTAPFSDPAYVALDVTILGVGGAPVPGLPQEATVRTKFEGFTTDPFRHIDLFGMDVDPCTGSISDRFWGSVSVDQGPPLGAVKGRWRFAPPTQVLSVAPTFLPATREVRARINSALVGPLAANGLLAGQYHAPISEYLFPENLGIGNPPVPLNLQDFPFLTKGSGPWGSSGAIVRQLAPWPGRPVPAPSNCPDVLPPPPGQVAPPVANVGLPLVVPPNFLVTLDGTGSFDPQGLPLTYKWTQTLGPALLLVNATTSTPSFVTPLTVGVIPLAFQLEVSNGFVSSSATASVNVVSNVDTVSILSATYRVSKQRLTVTASSTNPSAVLFLVIPGRSGVQMSLLNGVLTATLVGVTQPASVTVTSSLGGTATGPLTVVQ